MPVSQPGPSATGMSGLPSGRLGPRADGRGRARWPLCTPRRRDRGDVAIMAPAQAAATLKHRRRASRPARGRTPARLSLSCKPGPAAGSGAAWLRHTHGECQTRTRRRFGLHQLGSLSLRDRKLPYFEAMTAPARRRSPNSGDRSAAERAGGPGLRALLADLRRAGPSRRLCGPWRCHEA
jgi:hypothetical protein